jgi:putative CocE/NonD family hydrolase
MRWWKQVGAKVVDGAFGLPRATPYTVERDLPVPMPDGVTLLGDLYRPEEAPARLPTVLIRLPYGRAGLYGAVFVATYARRGFQVFVQSTRGTFGSGGLFRPFTTEKDDGLATLAWVREQPWSDGTVAMTGGSYFGHTQWAVAPYADPPLAAVSPHITAARITSAFYEHDAPGLDNALGWTANIGRQERRRLPIDLPPQQARYRKALSKLPLQAADTEVAGGPVPFWRDFTAHAEPGDDFWAVADHDHADLTKMPPVSRVTGWWDLFAAGQMRDYAALRAAGVPARIVVGPWRHGEPGELRAILRGDTE